MPSRGRLHSPIEGNLLLLQIDGRGLHLVLGKRGNLAIQVDLVVAVRTQGLCDSLPPCGDVVQRLVVGVARRCVKHLVADVQTLGMLFTDGAYIRLQASSGGGLGL